MQLEYIITYGPTFIRGILFDERKKTLIIRNHQHLDHERAVDNLVLVE